MPLGLSESGRLVYCADVGKISLGCCTSFCGINFRITSDITVGSSVKIFLSWNDSIFPDPWIIPLLGTLDVPTWGLDQALGGSGSGLVVEGVSVVPIPDIAKQVAGVYTLSLWVEIGDVALPDDGTGTVKVEVQHDDDSWVEYYNDTIFNLVFPSFTIPDDAPLKCMTPCVTTTHDLVEPTFTATEDVDVGYVDPVTGAIVEVDTVTPTGTVSLGYWDEIANDCGAITLALRPVSAATEMHISNPTGSYTQEAFIDNLPNVGEWHLRKVNWGAFV